MRHTRLQVKIAESSTDTKQERKRVSRLGERLGTDRRGLGGSDQVQAGRCRSEACDGAKGCESLDL